MFKVKLNLPWGKIIQAKHQSEWPLTLSPDLNTEAEEVLKQTAYRLCPVNSVLCLDFHQGGIFTQAWSFRSISALGLRIFRLTLHEFGVQQGSAKGTRFTNQCRNPQTILRKRIKKGSFNLLKNKKQKS